MNGTIWYEYDAARTDVLAKRNDECTRPSRAARTVGHLQAASVTVDRHCAGAVFKPALKDTRLACRI